MQLNRVMLKNYRSIKELEIKFDEKCRILVGINESGKTNILNALKLLDPKEVATRRDIREPGLHEAQVSEAYVRFIFTLSTEEAGALYNSLKLRVLSKTYSSPILITGSRQKSLDELSRSREGLYIVDVISGKKYASVWSFGVSTVPDNWKKISASCPADFSVVVNDAESVVLKSFAFVDTTEFSEIPPEYLEQATPEELLELVLAAMKQVLVNLPKVLFWDYDESKLLPPRVNLDAFCANPDSCIPLKRMFQLYKISDIKKAINEAKAGSSNALNNLLRRVAEATSQHFHSTWQEYEGIKFSLGVDGPDLVARIEDESNQYELSQRSDGFKRFVTFLLLVSAEEVSGLMKDNLLLIDEPEIGLHPSGARYLMEELIDISEGNYVVFSTHSIFMIDSKVIARHLIVKKKNEITSVEAVSESNIQDEEVIYKALGYSIFSNLKEKNFIFEGWKDKRLFETALASIPAGYEAIEQLNGLGRCFTHGVKQVKNVTPLFQAGNRRCLILTDCDPVAKEHQVNYQKNVGYGIWKRYDEVVNGSTAVTGEDFVRPEAFTESILNVSQKHNIPVLPIANLNGPGGKIRILRQWLEQNQAPQGELERSVHDIKDQVFAELEPADIKVEYYDYLRNLLPIVEAL